MFRTRLSNLNETRKSSNLTVSQVSEISKKDLEDLFHNFYDEYFDSSKITKSSTTNVETSNNEIPSHEEVFHESSESFQEKPSSFSWNDDVQQSSEEVMVSPTNTQSILNNMVGNGYPRKGQKSKPKRQNRARERKDREKSKSKSTPRNGIGKSIENRTRKPKLSKVGPPVPT
ncbi:hypothetical protein Tco_1581734 [Tanacetum coccineum]